jgi:hypothetical protein
MPNELSSKLGRQLDYASNRAHKKAKTSQFLDPNNVSPSGNRKFSEWKSAYDTEYMKGTKDYKASTKYDEMLGRVSMPQSGAHFRSLQNSYNTTSAHKGRKK